MATISTSQTFDSAARSAGEAFTINSGAVFTIDSDTRDGKNAAASRAGSMSSFTMTAATGGEVVLDGTNVWVIDYDGRIGTPNVPTLGTIIAGVTSGAYGELMNCSASISTTPTAAGSAMPATGIFKLKNVSGTFQDNETLEIQGSTDLCLANGVGKRGWIEVVMDDAATWTIGRAQKFTITGDWYQSSTTGSGSAHQQVQFPNYGGANFYLPGVWVDEAANGNWEFWPACITGTGTFWSASHMDTDARNKFCECLGGGIIRFGGNGTTAWGKVPTSGALFRVPNVFLKSAATASRASDSVPNGTLATRPDFTTTNAGQIDIDKAIGHWYMNSGQAYSVKLHYYAFFDQMQITECATALDLLECCNGNYTIAQDAAALVLTSNFAGGTIQDCKFGRTGTIASADYGTNVQYCNGITFDGCFFANRTFRTNAAGHPFYAAYCGNLTFIDCVVVGCSAYFLACADTIINNLSYADSHHTTSSSTTPPVGVIQLIGGTSDTTITGFNWYTSVANVHPDTAILYLNAAYGVKVRSIGTYASKLSAGSSNAMLYFCNDAGNSQDIEFKRIYFNLIATTFYNAVNSTKNVEITNCTGNISVTKNTVSAALNQIIKNSEMAAIAPASTASIYGSIFYHHFTSTTAGRLGLKFNEPTAEYTAYVTTSFSTSSTGTSAFNSTSGLALINSGDYAIFEYPWTIKGIDSFQNSAPTITTSTNMTTDFAINTGSGYGSWTTFNASNLSGLTVDENTGFTFKIRVTANATAAANLLTELYCLTSSNTTAQAIEYPLDTITASITVKDTVTLSAIQDARILLEANTGGPLPSAESVTITRSGSTASVTHTAHGMTAGMSVIIRGADQDEYNGVYAITNITTNAYDYTVSGTPATPATGTITATAQIMSGTTSALGVLTQTLEYYSDQPVIGKVRRATTGTKYKTGTIIGTIASTGLNVTVLLIADE